MNLLRLLELEERVGSLWHRLVGEKASWPHYPDQAARLDQVRGPLAVFFRGLGGDRGIGIAAANAKTSDHRLSLRQVVGMDSERLVMASRDEVSLALPETIAYFADPALNRDLYFWLAAFFAVLDPAREAEADPLAADLARIERARRATERALAGFPGLRARHAGLCAALLAVRPDRGLSGIEAAVEASILALLGGKAAAAVPAPLVSTLGTAMVTPPPLVVRTTLAPATRDKLFDPPPM